MVEFTNMLNNSSGMRYFPPGNCFKRVINKNNFSTYKLRSCPYIHSIVYYNFNFNYNNVTGFYYIKSIPN